MDRNLVYAKTPSGEEATRQRTRVVQRNLRMVLLQVDGQVTVNELVAKIGNEALVANALKELEKGGFICLAADAPSVWQQSQTQKKSPAKATDQAKRPSDSPISEASALSGASDFSDFDVEAVELAADPGLVTLTPVVDSHFSTFGKPIMPTLSAGARPTVPRYEGPSLWVRMKTGFQSLKGGAGDAVDAGGGEHRFSVMGDVDVRKLIFRVLGALLLLAAGTVVFYPYDRYRPDFERKISEIIGQPVRIQRVDVRFLPRPGMVLENVQLGEGGTNRIREVLIPQFFSLLGEGAKDIPQLIVSDASFTADFLMRSKLFKPGADSPDSRLHMDRVKFNKLILSIGTLTLPTLLGEAKFMGGKLASLSLADAGSSLQFEIAPGAEGATVLVDGNAWKPSGDDSRLVVSSLKARGLMRPGRIDFSEIDSNIFAGNVLGNASLDWSQGFVAEGKMQVSRLSARMLSSDLGSGAEIDGELSGGLSYRGEAANWGGLWSGMEATLNMTLTRGQINGVDLGEAARRGGVVRGGTTRFDKAFGTVKFSPQGVSCSDLDLDAGLMRGNGQFVVLKDKTVRAAVTVRIQSSVMPLTVLTSISGTLPTLETTVRK